MNFIRPLSCAVGSALGLLLVSTMPLHELALVPGSATKAGVAGPGDTAAPDTGACIDAPACIDRYLWSVYQRTPKIEVSGADFAWKDSEAAEKAGMSPMQYVIGGMDPGFKATLYRALRALDAAGFGPGIMCGFRDDYRQSITTGKMKAQNDRSFHGGSFRGGYGHGMAADVVSIKGRTLSERSEFNERMWDWIDRHGKELGIGRPYLNRDPPHVAPIDGEEYVTHRIGNARSRGRLPLATPSDHGGDAKRTGTAGPAKTPPPKTKTRPG